MTQETGSARLAGETGGARLAGETGGAGWRHEPAVSLQARPERRLIRPSGSKRHMDFAVRVAPAATAARARPALRLALVLDRSGSMHGAKLATAKRAALAVLDGLDERDQAAVVVFDDRIDVVLPPEAVTEATRWRVRGALAGVEARGSTALHEGWLTGCRTIAGDALVAAERLSRCFLLTDGLANAGVTDPERIATEAAGIREHAGIGTSTFGIGDDYDPGLLGPLATAGGGQFHNLRAAGEIASTFVNELGELLSVAARDVRLEVVAGPGVHADVVSAYWMGGRAAGSAGAECWTIPVGDLLGGEERHVVVRFAFPPLRIGEERAVRARLAWRPVGAGYPAERASDWQEVRLRCAPHEACDAEPSDPGVLHWVGLHHADRARQEAAERNRAGDYAGAQQVAQQVARRIAGYAGQDADLHAAVGELQDLEGATAAPMAPSATREVMAESLRRSKGQRDLR